MTAEPSAQVPSTNPNPSPQPPKLSSTPGLLAIDFYLFVLAIVIVVGVVGHHYPAVFLLISAAFMAVCGGLVLLLRWAWAGALSAVFLLACYNLWIFSTQHMGAALVQGLLNLVFFLYLIRTEVREKLS